MMQWFKQLSDNEQKLLKIGAILVFAALSWVFIYQPISKSVQVKIRKKTELSQQYQQLQSMQDILLQQKNKDKTYHRDLNKPFISWVDEQLEKQQLSQFVSRSEPKDNRTVILTFESIIFDELVAWLEPLEINYGVNITEVDINLIDRSNGLCSARITLGER